MPAQQVRVAEQNAVQFTANGRRFEELRRGVIYRELALRLNGTLTVAAANNTAANTLAGDEWAVVDRINIKANNNDVLKTVRGRHLRWLQYYLYGTFPLKTIGQIGDGATLNPAFDSTLILPFWQPRSRHPFDTVLDASVLANLRIEIDWLDHLAINALATGFADPPTLTPVSMESFGVRGPFSAWRLFDITETPSGANAQFQVRLPLGPRYRGFFIEQSTNTLINRVRLKSGHVTYFDLPWAYLNTSLFDQRRATHVQQALTANARWRASTAANDAHIRYAFIDLVHDGLLTESIDTLGFSEFILEFDVSGAGTLNVYPMQIFPLRRAAVARR